MYRPSSFSFSFIHIASSVVSGRYVDVSTVDDTTSKLISARIKDTGALFLEVGQFNIDCKRAIIMHINAVKSRDICRHD